MISKFLFLKLYICFQFIITLHSLTLIDTPGAPRQWWFGGGTDLTPAYIFEEDVKHFHTVSFIAKLLGTLSPYWSHTLVSLISCDLPFSLKFSINVNSSFLLL